MHKFSLFLFEFKDLTKSHAIHGRSKQRDLSRLDRSYLRTPLRLLKGGKLHEMYFTARVSSRKKSWIRRSEKMRETLLRSHMLATIALESIAIQADLAF